MTESHPYSNLSDDLDLLFLDFEVDNIDYFDIVFNADQLTADLKTFSESHVQIPDYVQNDEDYNILCAYVGDDEANITTDIDSVVTRLFFSEYLEIKISWEDVLFSPYILNFAEEWMLTPLNSSISWHSSLNEYHHETLPWILDGLKLKFSCPVRKSSDLETDLPSKYSHLDVAATWTNKFWFTKSFHELHKIFACVQLDLRNSDLFPFLGKEEGGCGGAPPWNSLTTCQNALRVYKRGNANHFILASMLESNQILQKTRKPSEATILQRRNYMKVHLRDEWTETEVLGIQMQREIPPELERQALCLTSEDYTLGILIARLRQQDEVMTEIDVLVHQEFINRLRAIYGEVPFRILFEEKELRATEHRAQFADALSAWWKLHHYTEVNSEDIEFIMRDYYKNQNKKIPLHSSFVYQGEIKVFDKRDVLNYFGQRNRQELLQAFWQGINFNVQEVQGFKKVPSLDSEILKIAMEYFHAIQHGKDATFPVGLIFDDARIAHEIQHHAMSKYSRTLYVVVTNDYDIVIPLKNYFRLGKDSQLRQLSLAKYHRLEKEPRRTPKPDLELPCLFQKGTFGMNSGNLIRYLDLDQGFTEILILFDVPNIRKTLAKTCLNVGLLARVDPGLLNPKFWARSQQEGRGISLIPIPEVYKFLKAARSVKLISNL